MTHDDFEAFKKAWLDYPSQDNEGYQPDRGGFKCGWFAALEHERKRSEILVKALEFYAEGKHLHDPSEWSRPGKYGYDEPVSIEDCGETAREALAEYRKAVDNGY